MNEDSDISEVTQSNPRGPGSDTEPDDDDTLAGKLQHKAKANKEAKEEVAGSSSSAQASSLSQFNDAVSEAIYRDSVAEAQKHRKQMADPSHFRGQSAGEHYFQKALVDAIDPDGFQPTPVSDSRKRKLRYKRRTFLHGAVTPASQAVAGVIAATPEAVT